MHHVVPPFKVRHTSGHVLALFIDTQYHGGPHLLWHSASAPVHEAAHPQHHAWLGLPLAVAAAAQAHGRTAAPRPVDRQAQQSHPPAHAASPMQGHLIRQTSM
eukprot:690953-Pelagomonas_calceolata.AAC.11